MPMVLFLNRCKLMPVLPKLESQNRLKWLGNILCHLLESNIAALTYFGVCATANDVDNHFGTESLTDFSFLNTTTRENGKNMFNRFQTIFFLSKEFITKAHNGH